MSRTYKRNSEYNYKRLKEEKELRKRKKIKQKIKEDLYARETSEN